MASRALITVLIAAALGAGAPLARAQAQQGVSKNEILLGTLQDLSGPIAILGKQARQGMMLRLEEANEQGGIHGRKLKLLVEDMAYDPKKAVIATQKLLNQERIFAMVGTLGTAPNMATIPLLIEKNTLSFMPLSSSSEMSQPLHRLKYASGAPYVDTFATALPIFVKEKQSKRPCMLYQDDDYGMDILRGSEIGLKSIGMAFTEKTSYKRGATDFSSQVSRLKSASCDLVVLATVVRETIGSINEARKIGFDPVFLISAGSYNDTIHKLGGPAMDGLFAFMSTAHPYLDDATPSIRFWATKYQTKFGEEPTILSVYGYQVVDIFVRAAQAAGPTLTTDTLVKALDRLTVPSDMFGSPELTYSPTKHLGSTQSRVSQIQNGRWKVVSGYPVAR